MPHHVAILSSFVLFKCSYYLSSSSPTSTFLFDFPSNSISCRRVSVLITIAPSLSFILVTQADSTRLSVLVAIPSFTLCNSLGYSRPQAEDTLVEFCQSVRLELSVLTSSSSHSPYFRHTWSFRRRLTIIPRSHSLALGFSVLTSTLGSCMPLLGLIAPRNPPPYSLGHPFYSDRVRPTQMLDAAYPRCSAPSSSSSLHSHRPSPVLPFLPRSSFWTLVSLSESSLHLRHT
ncbi:hypothetical protein EDB84DRAFT_1513979 [Lactarius hengduanensis]|nr:hypothetical protein EDB84DRAFT_1513979 [Lactarius hengduanensis]